MSVCCDFLPLCCAHLVFVASFSCVMLIELCWGFFRCVVACFCSVVLFYLCCSLFYLYFIIIWITISLSFNESQNQMDTQVWITVNVRWISPPFEVWLASESQTKDCASRLNAAVGWWKAGNGPCLPLVITEVMYVALATTAFKRGSFKEKCFSEFWKGGQHF